MPRAKKEKPVFVRHKKVFVEDVKVELRETIAANGKRVEVLRILRWEIDGTPTEPMLEKRRYVVKDNGERRMSRIGGLKLAEMDYIVANWSEIRPFFL